MIVKPANLKAFGNDFLEHYLEKGLGSLSKKDIDLLVLHLISQLEDLDNLSNHELALKLKITPSKVKTLRFDRNLRYQDDIKIDVKAEFLKCLSKAKFKKVGPNNWIALSIENTFVREGIKAQLKELDHFSDSSFNPEIVSLDKEAFLDLIDYYYSGEEVLKKHIKELSEDIKTLAKDKSNEITFKGLFKALLEGAAKEVGKKGVDIGLSALTGGASDGLTIINKIKGFFE